MSSLPFFNPATHKPDAERQFACRWELLRRHPEFRKDAEVWTQTWHAREALDRERNKLSEQERQSEGGRNLNEQLVRLSEQLFAMSHGSLPLVSCEPITVGTEEEGGKEFAADAEDQKKCLALRGWERAGYILCALKWMLPAIEFKPAKREHPWKPRMAGKAEEYRPQLIAKDLEENQKVGPLEFSQTWPETPPGFRRVFIHECTPGWKGDKVELLDLNTWAHELITIGNRISPGGVGYRRSTAAELKKVKDDIYAVAVDKLHMLASRFKCFLIPDGRVYPRSQFNLVIREIEKHFEIFNDGRYPKGAFLGRPNQWDAYLTAESLPPVNGHLDWYGAAKILVNTEKGKELRSLPSLGKNGGGR